MPSTTFDRYVDELVRSQPEPPRDPSWRELLLNSYSDRVALMLVAFGVAIALAGALTAMVAIGPLWQRAILFVVGGIGLVLFAGAPALRAFRYLRALRSGIRVLAEVITVTWTAPGIRPPTIEAGSNGMARGVRRVQHPAGDFEEPFEIDKPWALGLMPGDELLLLADPKRRRVLVDVGPSSVRNVAAGLPQST